MQAPLQFLFPSVYALLQEDCVARRKDLAARHSPHQTDLHCFLLAQSRSRVSAGRVTRQGLWGGNARVEAEIRVAPEV
jgi:hypothetical protein